LEEEELKEGFENLNVNTNQTAQYRTNSTGTLSKMIEQSERQSSKANQYQNSQGEISNIDHIYKKVFGK
jgi:hypothetical protein